MALEAHEQILGPPPAGSNWQTKILWFLADTAANALIYQSFDYLMEIQPTGGGSGDPPADVWMHIQAHFIDTMSGDSADDQIMTWDVVNYTGGAVDESWTTQDFTTVATQISTFFANTTLHYVNRLTLKEIRFYRRAFNPYSDPRPFAAAGGPAHVHPVNLAMTGLGSTPPQVTSTITEETPSRKHWGRFYLPTLSNTTADVTGRLNGTVMADLIDEANALYAGWSINDFRAVVPTTSSGGTYHPELKGDWSTVPARTLQGVTGVRIDDVIDTQRRRRFNAPGNRLTRPTLP